MSYRRIRRGGFGRGLGRRPLGIGGLLYRLPALTIMAAAGLAKEMMRPNSLLRPMLVRLLSDARKRRSSTRAGTRTEVKGSYRIVDEQPCQTP